MKYLVETTNGTAVAYSALDAIAYFKQELDKELAKGKDKELYTMAFVSHLLVSGKIKPIKS